MATAGLWSEMKPLGASMSMSAVPLYTRGREVEDRLSAREWLTIIAALLHDRSSASTVLGKRLLVRTKHGRHIRLLRLLLSKPKRVQEIKTTLRISRRTVFRDLNDLEAHGVRLSCGEDFRYHVERIPPILKRLL